MDIIWWFIFNQFKCGHAFQSLGTETTGVYYMWFIVSIKFVSGRFLVCDITFNWHSLICSTLFCLFLRNQQRNGEFQETKTFC